MTSERRIHEYEQAGADWLSDWLSWNEKKLAACQTLAQKQLYISREADISSVASDMAHCIKDSDNDKEHVGTIADWVYNGISKALKAYYDKHR
jgi:hypothetical protein